MPTAWTNTSVEIIRDALETCQAVGVGEPVAPEDAAVCLRALNGLLKELPIHGINWFKLSSASVSVSWSGGTPSVVTLPTDYFGTPVLKFTDASGVLVQLGQIAKPEYELVNIAQTGTYPKAFYVAPNKSVYLWPVPTQDPVLRLTYQAIASDATLTATPDIEQAFLSGLTDWLADKIALKFAPPEIRKEINQRALQARLMMIQWSTELAPIRFTVDNE